VEEPVGKDYIDRFIESAYWQ